MSEDMSDGLIDGTLASLAGVEFCRCPDKTPLKHTYRDGENLLDVEICNRCFDLIAARMRRV